MAFKDCILAQASVLPPKKAQELADLWQETFDKYSRTMGDLQAAEAAADRIVGVQSKIIYQQVMNEIAFARGLKKIRAEVLSSAARIEAEKASSATGTKWAYGDPTMRAILGYMDKAYQRARALENMTLVRMGQAVEQYRSKAGGFKQDSAGFVDVVREMAGKATGNDAAKAAGLAMKEAIEGLQDMYRASGGIMGKLDDWIGPHVHNPQLLKRAGFNAWHNKILPLLDRDRMIDLDTGLPMSDKKLFAQMKEDYEAIISGGLIDLAKRADEGGQRFGIGGGPSKRRMESRFYHFKDVDGWLDYNREFGVGDVGLFDAYINHVGKMARDTALIQVMTPNPDGVMRNMDLEMAARGVKTTSQFFVRGSYDILTGRADMHGDLPLWYKAANNWLHIKRAAYLTGAPISAMSDSFYGALAAKMNGLPAMDIMGRYFSLLNPANMQDRKIARTLFHVAGAVNGHSLSAARFADDLGQPGGIFSFMSGVTNRLSGLAQMTDAMKQAFPMETAAMFSRFQDEGTAWADLAPELRASMEAAGLAEADYQNIMKAPKMIEPETGAEYLRAEEVMGIDQNTALKYNDWITAIANYAINEPGLATRAVVTGAGLTGQGAPHGSLIRLIFSNSFFAKSFGVSVMINHTLPMIREAGQGRFGRMAVTVLGTTIMGALAMQARQVLFGKDPKDMTTPKFWTAAMLQGGGFGLFGDFLFSDTSRTNNTFAETIAGPIPGTLWNIAKAGDLYSLGTDVDVESVAADLFRLANKEAPVIHMWYTRMIVERMFLDQIERAIDPDYDDRIRRMESRMEKQANQGFWWKPGEMLPERSPDLATAIGD